MKSANRVGNPGLRFLFHVCTKTVLLSLQANAFYTQIAQFSIFSTYCERILRKFNEISAATNGSGYIAAAPLSSFTFFHQA